MLNSMDRITSLIVLGMWGFGLLFIISYEIARLIKEKIIAKEYKKIKETKKIEIEVIKEKIEHLPKNIEYFQKIISDNMRLTNVVHSHYPDKLKDHLYQIKHDQESLKNEIKLLSYYQNKLATLEFEQTETKISQLMYVPEKYNTPYRYIDRNTNQTKMDICFKDL